MFQFYHDTRPIKGCLDELLSLIDEEAIGRAIKIGVCNIYHGCIHNMLYEKSDEILKDLYKSASFVIQAINFKKTGSYIRHLKELSAAVIDDEKEIINTFINLKNGKKAEFCKMSETLFCWCKNWINRV